MPPRRQGPRKPSPSAKNAKNEEEEEETVTTPTLPPPSRLTRSKKTPASASAASSRPTRSKKPPASSAAALSAATSTLQPPSPPSRSKKTPASALEAPSGVPPAPSVTLSTPSSNHKGVPAEVRDFFHEHKDNLTEYTFLAFCQNHLNETVGGTPPGLPKHYWRTLLKENPSVSRRIGKKSIGKKRTKKNVVNNVMKVTVEPEGMAVGLFNRFDGVLGVGGGGEVSGEEEEGEEDGITTPVTSNEPLLDLSTCDNSTREAVLLRMPHLPPSPESYTIAAKQFPPKLLHSAGIPDQTAIHSDPDTTFYFRYIRNTLQTLFRLRQKFIQPSWAPEIKEGWYDSNLWPYFIDYLFSRSSTLSLLRKELAIIPGQSERDRYDGVFRCIKKGFRFDLGVIEVSRLSDRPNSDMKATIDRRKIVRGMQSLLGWARKRVEDEGLQVVGILCSGWSVTLFRMSYDAELKYIVDQQHFAIEWDVDFHGNLEIMEALVQHVEIMEQTAAAIVSRGRMIN